MNATNQHQYRPEVFSSLLAQYGPRIRQLPCKPEETTEASIRALWLCAMGIRVSSSEATGLPLGALSNKQWTTFQTLLERRAQGEPLAYLTGRQRFMGLEYECGPSALIPRLETEILGRTACRLLTEEILPVTRNPVVLDLCTGSGNLACAVACHVPQCEVFASDLSREATLLARENARRLECQDRVKLFVGDLFGPFHTREHAKTFDLIMCNPPYISTPMLPRMAFEILHHEPVMALDAGPFGLGVISRLLRDAPDFSRPGGWLAFEVGQGQGAGILRRISSDDRFTCQSGIRDSQSIIRVIVAKVCGGHADRVTNSNQNREL